MVDLVDFQVDESLLVVQRWPRSPCFARTRRGWDQYPPSVHPIAVDSEVDDVTVILQAAPLPFYTDKPKFPECLKL